MTFGPQPEVTELYNTLGRACLGYDRMVVCRSLTRLLADTIMEMYSFDRGNAEQEAEDAFAAIRNAIALEAN
jgi:hypothetical protein